MALKLSKSDARRALVRHQFTLCADAMEAFGRLRSVQFDPIAPVGCNHDLVLQARVPGYRIGDWEKLAYQSREIYDGWDKQACLVPFEGWPWRRIFHEWHRPKFRKIFDDHSHAVDAILAELEARGPLATREFKFKERKSDWAGTWFGPNLAKVTLRALWHTGKVMTVGRRNGHHIYDLSERVVPQGLRGIPELDEPSATRELVRERFRAMGIIKPSAPYEVWSYQIFVPERKVVLAELVDAGEIVPVEIDKMKGYASTEFLGLLDEPAIAPRVVFVAPLDQVLWDRKAVSEIFDFDYAWEIYTPESKRRWGYYVLPVLFGNDLVARIEFYCRNGHLEIRQWHVERELGSDFMAALEIAAHDFAGYASVQTVSAESHVDPKIAELFRSAIANCA